jgi:hypothetical protein
MTAVELSNAAARIAANLDLMLPPGLIEMVWGVSSI